MTATAGQAPSADRIYSLDTTPPVDYEPSEVIDYARASLTELADHFKTDKGSIKHRYTEVYEKYLGPLRQKPGVKLLEIGVACGSSLKTWSRYFSDAEIIGADIRPDCSQLCRSYPNIRIEIGNATQQTFARDCDVIIDDGSHVSADIVDALRVNWPALKPGGLYVIEDLKCTHNPAYPKLLPFKIEPDRFDRRHFISFINNVLMQMDWRQSDVEFVHFYREMAILRKMG
ncbi:class I SAM-dependent methyltransferase [Ferrovibrio xuzhouensis]|uniref:Class I SAM-dependent methyltransferase n=1 Tax=Ferrovibrio xuzhouensis TaxID=1576914 RepID=A0ABV7VG08_9PROT